MSYAVGDLVTYDFSGIDAASEKIGVVIGVRHRKHLPPLIEVHWTTGHTREYEISSLIKVG